MNRLGRYELGPLLGQGGAGAVYEATLLGAGGFRKQVALKVMPEGETALRREARIGGLLRHRHLVDVYEVDQADGHWFCAMELCRGGALTAHLPLPPRAVIEVGLQVCAALKYAHEALGLVHLDLKPDNLLLTEHGDVKVADLGIADARGFEGLARIRGTPGYMAPEQAGGGHVDARADIYALGVTLVELATGERAMASGTFTFDEASWDDEGDDEEETFDLYNTVDVDSLDIHTDAEALQAVPGWLIPIVVRCLATHPDDRFPDMAALAAALEELSRAVEGPGLSSALGLDRRAPEPVARTTHNLPAEAPGFVGRAAAAVIDALHQPGLVTLVGPAGIGKTRLCVRAARAFHDAGRGPVWFCDLTAARSRNGLLHAVAAALDVPLRGAAPAATLGHAIAARGPMVLVLDNFEHLLQHAELVGAWAARADACRFVVTSRRALNLPGEQVLPVRELAPDDARAMLVARAALRGADVRDDPDLDRLVDLLEGLPLAIELAAGRLGVLTARDVADRLGRGILRSDREGRHETLQAALAWSWDLLTPTEKQALAQLTVFSGGFTRAAAEAVLMLPDGAGAHAVVEALVAHSLVRADAARLRLLVSVGAFVESQEDPGDAAVRHGVFFAQEGTALAERAHRHGGAAQLRIGSADLDNFWMGCTRACAAGRGAVATGCLEGAWAVLELKGPFPPVTELASQVCALPDLAPSHRATAHRIASLSSRLSGRAADAVTHAEAALALSSDDLAGQARAHSLLGVALAEQGQPDDAQKSYEAALRLFWRSRDPVGEGRALNNLGTLFLSRGRLDEARTHFEAALAAARDVGDRFCEGLVLGNLGVLHHQQEHVEEALRCYRGSLEVARELGNQRGVGMALGNLGSLHDMQGRPEQALELYDAMLEITRELGDLRHEGMLLGNIGAVCRDLGRLDDARAHAEASLRIARETHDQLGEAFALADLGDLEALAGAPAAARDHYQAAVDISAKIGDPAGHGRWLVKLARIEAGARGLAMLDEALPMLQAHSNPSTVAKAMSVGVELRVGLGDLAGARAALAEARSLGEDLTASAVSALEQAAARLEEAESA